MKEGKAICIDFDGTCVTHDFPEVGKDIGAQKVLSELVENGHKLILFTMRSNSPERSYLNEAVEWFDDNDIPLYGIQFNPSQASWTQSNKAYGHLYIDDAALGIPLNVDPDLSLREFVDWTKVREMLVEGNYIKEVQTIKFD